MNCLKCGKEIEHDQVFCPECLAQMEQYPVKPGIVVQLPSQKPEKNQPAARQTVRMDSAADLEKKLRRLRRGNRALGLLCVFLVLVTMLATMVSFKLIGTVTHWGQNYSTETSASAPG